MELKKPLNNKLFSEMKPYIQLNAKFKDQTTYISSSLRGSWIKYASTFEKRSTHTNTNSNKYVVNQHCRHFDFVRKILVRIRVFFVLVNKTCLFLREYIWIQVTLSFNINSSSIQYAIHLCFAIFVIDYMLKTNVRQNWYVLYSAMTQCFLCLWTAHSCLPFSFLQC